MGRSGASSSHDGKASAEGREQEGAAPEQEEEEEEEQSNHRLPLACVVRIMRQALPPDVKISGSAKKLAQGCATEFAGAVANEAAVRCRQEERRKLAPEDLAWSLQRLGLDRYAAPLATYLRRYREAGRNGGTSASASGSSSTVPPPAAAVEGVTDEELVRVLARMMADASASSSAHPRGYE